MSIVLKRSCGYLVDHEQAINLTCGSLPFESRRSIFGIFQPYNARKIRTSVFTTNCESNNSSTKLETSSCGTESDKSKKVDALSVLFMNIVIFFHSFRSDMSRLDE